MIAKQCTINDLLLKIEDTGKQKGEFESATLMWRMPHRDFKSVQFGTDVISIGSPEFCKSHFMNYFSETAFYDIGGVAVALCAANELNEIPVSFFLYIDEHDELRGYVPENGNPYNHRFKCAYGSEIRYGYLHPHNQEEYEKQMEKHSKTLEQVHDEGLLDVNAMLVEFRDKFVDSSASIIRIQDNSEARQHTEEELVKKLDERINTLREQYNESWYQYSESTSSTDVSHWVEETVTLFGDGYKDEKHENNIPFPATFVVESNHRNIAIRCGIAYFDYANYLPVVHFYYMNEIGTLCDFVPNEGNNLHEGYNVLADDVEYGMWDNIDIEKMKSDFINHRVEYATKLSDGIAQYNSKAWDVLMRIQKYAYSDVSKEWDMEALKQSIPASDWTLPVYGEEFDADGGYLSCPYVHHTINFENYGMLCFGCVHDGVTTYFYLYIDADNKLRAYIPNNGNVYDHEYNCLYGDEDSNEDFAEMKSRNLLSYEWKDIDGNVYSDMHKWAQDKADLLNRRVSISDMEDEIREKFTTQGETSIEEIEEKTKKANEHANAKWREENAKKYINIADFIPPVRVEDFDEEKIVFEHENIEYYKSFNISNEETTVRVHLFNAHGLGEHPVYFAACVKPDNVVRIYIPKKGNTYNAKTNSAYGAEADALIQKPEYDYDDMQSNFDAMTKYLTQYMKVMHTSCDTPPNVDDELMKQNIMEFFNVTQCGDWYTHKEQKQEEDAELSATYVVKKSTAMELRDSIEEIEQTFHLVDLIPQEDKTVAFNATPVTELEYKEKNGYAVAMGEFGGEWEKPVTAAFYMDVNGYVRMYIPKNGNTYNTKTNTAFGSESEALNLQYEDKKQYFNRLIHEGDQYASDYEKITRDEDAMWNEIWSVLVCEGSEQANKKIEHDVNKQNAINDKRKEDVEAHKSHREELKAKYGGGSGIDLSQKGTPGKAHVYGLSPDGDAVDMTKEEFIDFIKAITHSKENKNGMLVPDEEDMDDE